MLFDFFKSHQESKYQVKYKSDYFNFFSNNNISIRKKSYNTQQISYKPQIEGAEDFYLCLKYFYSSWRIYSSKELFIWHRARKDLPSLLKQFWFYGKNGAIVLGHFKPSVIEVYKRSSSSLYAKTNNPFRTLILKTSPITVLCYLSRFTLFLINLFLSIFYFPFILIASIFFIFQLKDDLIKNMLPPQKRIQLFCVRFLVNLSFFTSSVLYALRYKYVYFPQLIEVNDSKSFLFINKNESIDKKLTKYISQSIQKNHFYSTGSPFIYIQNENQNILLYHRNKNYYLVSINYIENDLDQILVEYLLHFNIKEYKRIKLN